MSEILKYFKEFATESEYDTYINGSPILPNVSFVKMDVFYKDKPDYSSQYLTFKITNAGDIKWYTNNTGATRQISYSRDSGTSWTEITSNTGSSAPSISVNAGDTIMLKGTNDTYGNSSYYYSCFSGSTAGFEVEGNIMSLIYGDDFKDKTSFPSGLNNFIKFFQNCTGLTSVENLILPVTTLRRNCYNGMFSGCTSLVSAPALPAATLADNCYETMFVNCTSLTKAPELPATTLANYCYYNMFQGCRSLVTAPSILPATTLADNCYAYMFYGCGNLNYIKCLATDISASVCTDFWVHGVASTGTFVKAASMESWPTGVNGIPNGWTVEDAA